MYIGLIVKSDMSLSSVYVVYINIYFCLYIGEFSLLQNRLIIGS